MPITVDIIGTGPTVLDENSNIKSLTTVYGIVNGNTVTESSTPQPGYKALSKITYNDDTVDYSEDIIPNADLLQSGICCDNPEITPAPVEIVSSCDEPVFVQICNPTPDIEKVKYCNDDTNTQWIKVCQYDTSTIPATEIVLSDTDTGHACGVSFDYELQQIDTCVNGEIQTQFYYIEFDNGVPQPAVAIGAPINTGKDCDNVEFDLIKTNWLPICVDGSQWYVAEQSVYDNIAQAEGVITKIYKEGANGSITLVAPTGIVTEGYCPSDKVETIIDVECNSVSNNYDYISTTYTNGVAGTPVVVDSGRPCDDVEPDYEVRKSCENGTIVERFVGLVNGNEIFIGDPFDTQIPCTKPKPDCVESQEYTFAKDNTGTHWGWDADYEIEWSDGRVTPFSQVGVPPADNWSGQMANQWQPNIQNAINANQIGADVTVRFRNNSNNNDISGIPAQGAAPAIPGPPSTYISNNLGAIAWRYINIQVCLGQPLPVSFRLVGVTNDNGFGGNTTPRDLVSTGPILGELKKFFVCHECGESPVWYLEDGVTRAELGEIPTCSEPCGTTAQSDSPAKTTCDFESEFGCDDVNDDGTNVVGGITRIFKLCPNSTPELFGYFVTDASGGLVEYNNGNGILGSKGLVDCSTLEPIGEPQLECSEFELTTLYKLDNITAGLVGSQYETGLPTATSAQQGDSELVGTILDSLDINTMTQSTAPALVAGSLVLDDNNNTASVQDVEYKEGYLIVTESQEIRWTTNSEGALRVELGICCGELVEQFTYAKEVGVVPSPSIVLPKGIHKIKLTNFDFGGSNSNWTAQYNNGLAWTSDNTPPGIAFSSTKPNESCVKAKVCEDTGAVLDLWTGVSLAQDEHYYCSLACSPVQPSIKKDTLCDGSEGFKVENVCCKNLEATRWGRTYNSDNNVLSGEGFHTTSGYDSLLNDFGCPASADKKIFFQGAVYVDGVAYPYATNALTIPASEQMAKQHLINAMNQAVAGTGASLRYVNNGQIEMRGGDVDLAYSVQKGMLDGNGDICWDSQYFIYRDDADGTVQGDSIDSPVPNPYDSLAVANLQNGNTGAI